MICLSFKRKKGLWTWVGLNSPVSTKGHTRVGFCGGVLPDIGAHLNTRKEDRATWELWEVSLHEEGLLLLVVSA